MRGTVVAISSHTGMFAVQTEKGSYSVIEPLGDYKVQVGDIIKGNLEALAGETVYNISKSEEMDVFLQDFHCSLEHAIELIS